MPKEAEFNSAAPRLPDLAVDQFPDLPESMAPEPEAEDPHPAGLMLKAVNRSIANRPPPNAPEPPPVPTELMTTIWPTIEKECSPAYQAGMRWWLAGYSWRESCSLAGYNNHNRLRIAVYKYGLQKYALRSDRIVRAHREIAAKTSEVLLDRLETEPEKIQSRDLGLILGMSTDKIRDYESWTKMPSAGGNVLNAFEQLARALADGHLSLKLEVTPAGHAGDGRPTLTDHAGPETIEINPVQPDQT